MTPKTPEKQAILLILIVDNFVRDKVIWFLLFIQLSYF